MNLKTNKKNQIVLNDSFWNQTFDKGRLKNFVLWFLLKHGEYKTVKLVEELKTLGFQYATKAGISLGIEDLMIPKRKNILIMEAEKLSINTIKEYKRNEITGVERFQRLIDTWHRTSERLKQEVIENFEATDILNPVYMMAFSGARGNISQVRQLVGMRGLMSNPQGQIIDFPIRSNFREGLTLTEYIISSYGARKGIVDTALRTANAGYLTRRLVDVAQHVIISNFDCGTKRGIFLTDMKEGNKIIYSLQNRLVGRVLARDIFNQNKIRIATRNTEISSDLSNSLAGTCKKVFVRSSLTCQTRNLVCQLCYGWSLAQGNLVGIGEAVGVVAAQSIGEPGTQLTMRTFHTGGVFSGDVSDQIKAPYDGIVIYDNPIAGTLIRTPEGKIAFLTKNEGSVSIFSNLLSISSLSSSMVAAESPPTMQVDNKNNAAASLKIMQAATSDKQKNYISHTEKMKLLINSSEVTQKNVKKFKIPFYTLLFFKNGEKVLEKEVIAQISSINRQKNATDQAEFTINAELSGQFFSKLLNLKENKVGPKLKAGKLKVENNVTTCIIKNNAATRIIFNDAAAKKITNQVQGPEILIEQFNEAIVDTIYEAWGWGYAWVLSGKIYQLPQTSNFFPIVGDFVNNKTYMNKNKLNLSSSFGNSFKLSIPLRKSFFNKKIIKKLRTSKDITNIIESYNNNRDMAAINHVNSEIKQDKSLIYKPIIKKDITFLKTELISLKLSNIIYKKFGYFIKLTKPTTQFQKSGFLNLLSDLSLSYSQSRGIISQMNETKIAPLSWKALPSTSMQQLEEKIESRFSKNTPKSFDCEDSVILNLDSKTSILSKDDTIFLLSSLDKNLLETNGSEDITIHNEKESYPDKNSFIYPSKWVSSFDVFLNWFPKRFYTKTGGLIFMEPIFFNTLLNSTNKIKENSIIASKIMENQINNLSTYMVGSDHAPNLDSEFKLTNTSENNAAAAASLKIMQAGTSINIKKYFNNKKIKNLSSIYIDTMLDSNFQENDLFVNQIYLINNYNEISQKNNQIGQLDDLVQTKMIQQLDNESIYKLDKKNVYFFPTFIKRNLLKNKVKQATNKNKETIIEKQTLNNSLLIHSLNKSLLKDDSKSLIFEQYQSKEIGTLIIGTDKQSPSLSKNKKPSTLLTYGLNWKNNFKLNFSNFSSFKKQINPDSPFGICEPEFTIGNYQSKALRNEKLNTKYLQRIFYIPEFFYKFSLKKLAIKKTKIGELAEINLLSNNISNHLDKVAASLKIMQVEQIKTIAPTQGSLPSINSNNQFSISDVIASVPQTIGQILCPIDSRGTAILQLNRQGKFKKYYLDHGYLNSHFSSDNTSGSFKLNIDPFIPPACIIFNDAAAGIPSGFIHRHPKETDDQAGSVNIDNSEVVAKKEMAKFKKLYVYSKFAYNSILEKDPIFSFSKTFFSYAKRKESNNNYNFLEKEKNYNLKLVKELKKRKKILLNNFIYNIEQLKPPFNSITYMVNSVSTGSAAACIIKNNAGSPTMQAETFHINPAKKIKTLNSKQLLAPANNNNKISNIMQPNKNKENNNFDKLTLKTFSKMMSFPYFLNKKSSNLLNKNLISLSDNVFSKNDKKINNFSLFNYHFYSCFNKNKKKQILLNNSSYNYPSINMIKKLFKNSQAKFNVICSPYLKKQLKYSFYLNELGFVLSSKDKIIKDNYFYRILNINNFLSNSSLVFATQMLFYKKGFFYLGFFEESKKTIVLSNSENLRKNVKIKVGLDSNQEIKKLTFSNITPQNPSSLNSNLTSSIPILHGYNMGSCIIQNNAGSEIKEIIIEFLKVNTYTRLNSLNSFSINQRIKTLQIWLKKAFYFKTLFLKSYKNLDHSFIKSNISNVLLTSSYTVDAGKTSHASGSFSKQSDAWSISKTSLEDNIDFKFLNKKKYKIYSQSKANDYLHTQKLSSLINLSVKPGWFYFTKNLSKFLFYNRNFIHPGKIVGEDFIFDNDPIYLEVMPFDNRFKNIKTFNLDPFKMVKEDSIIDSISSKPKFIKRSDIKTNKFTKIIKNNKCRFEPNNLKDIFEAKKTKINSDFNFTKNDSFLKNNNKGFFIFIRKANEYKLHKDFLLKKEMHKLSNQSNLNNSKISILEKIEFSRTKNYNQYIWSSQTPLKIYNFTKILEKNKIQSINFNIKSKASFNYQIKTIFTMLPPDCIHPDSLEGKAFTHAATGRLSRRQIDTINEKKINKQVLSFKLNRFDYTNENSIHLYNNFKTPFINKQKIASQIISKYPSSDLKIISKIPFYSSLLMFKTKLFNSFQSKFYNLPFKNYFNQNEDINANNGNLESPPACMVGSDHAAASLKIMQPQFLTEKAIKSVKIMKKISLTINKQNSWGIALMPVTAKTSINLLPFIISYKAPYSIEFPFKYPIRFFCEQRKFNYSSFSSINQTLKKILTNYRLKIAKLKDLKNIGTVPPEWSLTTTCIIKNNAATQPPIYSKGLTIIKKKIGLEKNYLLNNKIKSILSTLFFCPIAEYSLGKNIEKSILYPNNIMATYPIQNTRLFISNQNFIYNKKFFSRKYKEKISFISSKIGPVYLGGNKKIKSMPSVLGSLNNFLDFSPKYKINNEVFLYKTEFESFSDNKISPLLPFVNSYNYCCFEGELIFKSLKYLIKQNNNSVVKQNFILASPKSIRNKTNNLIQVNDSYPVTSQNNLAKFDVLKKINVLSRNDKVPAGSLPNMQVEQLKKNKIKSLDQENLENELFSNKRLGDSCIILTKKDQLSFYLDSSFSFNNNIPLMKTFPTFPSGYVIGSNNLDRSSDDLAGASMPLVKSQSEQFKLSQNLNYKEIYGSLEDFKKKNRYLINETIIKFLNVSDQNSNISNPEFEFSNNVNSPDGIKQNKKTLGNFYKINKLPIGTSHQKNKLLLGEFLVYGDQISPSLSVTKAGQIIHINNKKVTLRHGQPIFVSPKAILHKYDTDFIEEQSPVITLSYQQLKTGDIIQGIPKVEQFFEARTTKRGRLFRDSLKNLLKGLFKRYCSKGQPSDQAVRQSFYKIQQIIVDGVQRVYRSQGVSIADKHLEVIVKQMTSKVRITEGGQTGFFPGEIVDLNFIEQVNTLLMRKITYEPLVLGITKASLEVDSFLSAASFQQTTRVLSNAALSRKKDFLKGLKENVILGNLIPAGTGYLVYLD